MYFLSLCSTSRYLYIRNSNKVLSLFYLNLNIVVTTPKCSISTSVLDRRRSILSNSKVSNISTRHSHDDKKFPLLKLRRRIPKKLIRWKPRMLLALKLADGFDASSFFDGVTGTFVHVTDCVANGEDSALQDLLTDSALQAVTEYITDAKVDKDPYQVEEKDIDLLLIKAVDFEQAEEYRSLRDVTVLSIYVEIVYKLMGDYIKVFESSFSSFTKDDTMSNIAKKVENMEQKLKNKHLFKMGNYHAEFKFQRAFDKELENPLTDWMIAAIAYRIPKRADD